MSAKQRKLAQALPVCLVNNPQDTTFLTLLESFPQLAERVKHLVSIRVIKIGYGFSNQYQRRYRPTTHAAPWNCEKSGLPDREPSGSPRLFHGLGRTGRGEGIPHARP